MNEYISTVEGEKRAIKILNDEFLLLDGRETEYSLLKTSDTSYILKIGDRIFDIVASNLGSDKFGFLIDGSYFEVEVRTALQEKARELIRNSNGSKHHAEMRAPMPGLILKINKKAGEKIEIGDSIFILEAMKMENDLRSPSSGVIKDIRVKEGDSVEKNTVLLIIE
jgi:acetyl/propionyl-CoA carboxylase alpha subunit